MNSLPLSVGTSASTVVQQRWFLLVAATGSFVLHTPDQRLRSLFPNLVEHLPEDSLVIVHTVRSMLFLGVIAFFIFHLFTSLYAYFRKDEIRRIIPTVVRHSALTFGFLGLLTFPFTLGIMGVGYAQLSVNPFHLIDGTDQLYQRLLVPAMAYYLQFQGPFLYHLFSLSVTLLSIFFLQLFFIAHGIKLSLLESVSIGTGTFIMTQFQSPGYTDPFIILCVLILWTVPTDTISRMVLAATALFAHEASVLLFGAIALLYFSREEQKMYAVVVFVYAWWWIASFGFQMTSLAGVRTVGELNGWEWFMNEPGRAVIGLLLSYKLLWMILAAAVFHFYRSSKEFGVLLLPGILVCFMAVDTTRLLALSLLPFLFAIVYVKRFSLIPEPFYNTLLWLNILLPSFYVGLNSGMVTFNGLYQWLYFGTMIR